MPTLQQLPDVRGHFGPYGGMFVPETLMTALARADGRIRTRQG